MRGAVGTAPLQKLSDRPAAAPSRLSSRNRVTISGIQRLFYCRDAGADTQRVFQTKQWLSDRPAAAPSYLSLNGQRKVAERKPTRGSRIARKAGDVPCATGPPRAGTNSAIPGLEHACLAPVSDCVARRAPREFARACIRASRYFSLRVTAFRQLDVENCDGGHDGHHRQENAPAFPALRPSMAIGSPGKRRS